MKRFTAILSAGLLVWGLFASVPAATACGKPGGSNCAAACGGHMACCAAKPDSSQPAPAVPAQSGAENEISLPAPAMVAWMLPGHPASLVASVNVPPLAANGAPLFTRHCALLI